MNTIQQLNELPEALKDLVLKYSNPHRLRFAKVLDSLVSDDDKDTITYCMLCHRADKLGCCNAFEFFTPLEFYNLARGRVEYTNMHHVIANRKSDNIVEFFDSFVIL